jgi:hypothetical protein
VRAYTFEDGLPADWHVASGGGYYPWLWFAGCMSTEPTTHLHLTGPCAGHNGGRTSHYLGADATDGVVGSRAELTTDPINANVVGFWFLEAGHDAGALTLSARLAGVGAFETKWTSVGDQGSAWRYAEVCAAPALAPAVAVAAMPAAAAAACAPLRSPVPSASAPPCCRERALVTRHSSLIPFQYSDLLPRSPSPST